MTRKVYCGLMVYDMFLFYMPMQVIANSAAELCVVDIDTLLICRVLVLAVIC